MGNSRKLKLITENDSKSDKVDARLLSKLGCLGVEWVHPVYQRSEEVQTDLVMAAAVALESRAVFEELLLPTIENRRLEAQLVT